MKNYDYLNKVDEIDDLLNFISETAYSNNNFQFLKKFSKFLVNLVRVNTILINTYSSTSNGKAKTIVICHEGRFLKNISYKIADTPEEKLTHTNFCIFPKNVKEKFPKDDSLIHLNAESYIGIPLKSSNGKRIGFIALMDKEPLSYDTFVIEKILKVAAIKITNILKNQIYKDKIKLQRKDLRVVKRIIEDHDKFKSIILSSEDMVSIHNLDGVCLYYNETSKFPIKENDILGKTPFNIFENTLATQIVKSIKEVGNTGLSKIDEVTTELFNEKVWLSMYYYRVSSGNKSETKVMKICKNITKHKKFEEENKKLSTIVSQSANNIILTDINGNIEYVNPSFSKTTGYTQNEVIGKNPNILSSGQHSNKFYSILWKTIKAGKIWKGEFRNKTKSGKLIWERATISAIKNEQGEITNFLSIREDITKQKKAKEALNIALQKAKEADNLKSAFLANMSHEIRTPMNGIIGFSELLLQKDLSDTNRVKYAQIILDSSKNLLTILNDILFISRIEAGVIKLNKDTFDLNRLLDELYVFYLNKAQEKNLSLKSVKGLQNHESIIKSDKIKLRQILKNLLSNSLKYTNQGTIEFGYKLIQNELEFFVIDSGIGIKPESKNKVFKRFYREDAECENRSAGAGLGLSISKKFIKLMRGKIWFNSNSSGTTMYFRIPYNKKTTIIDNTTVEKTQLDVELTHKDVTILVVDDELFNRVYIQELFSKTTFNILEAENGKRALDLYFKNPNIDLVLMDIQMPVMNGIDCMKRIKENNPEIPVIGISAFAMESDMKNALIQGFDFYISKPIDKNILFHSINKYLID